MTLGSKLYDELMFSCTVVLFFEIYEQFCLKEFGAVFYRRLEILHSQV